MSPIDAAWYFLWFVILIGPAMLVAAHVEGEESED